MFDTEKDNLSKLNINELRDKARELGITTPTIYSKESLIEKILEGDMQYKGSRGRPSNQKREDDDSIGFRQVFKNNSTKYEINCLSPLRTLNSDNNFKNKYVDNTYLEREILKTNFSGYIYKDGDEIFLVSNNLSDRQNIVRVPSYVINEIFKIGDYTSAICIDSPEGKIINQLFGSELQYKRGNYLDISRSVIEAKSIIIKGYGKYLIGGRNILLASQDVDFFSLLSCIRDRRLDNTISLHLSVMPEQMSSMTKDDFYAINGEDYSTIFRAMDLFYCRIKRYVEDGEKVNAFLDDIYKIYSICFLQPQISTSPYAERIRQCFLNIFNTAGAYVNGASVTISTFAKEDAIHSNIPLREMLNSLNVHYIKAH